MMVFFRRFARDDRGAELVQFAVALPILITLVWSSFEIYQLATLRAAVRTSASQIARYITAYGAAQPEIGYVPPAGDICNNILDLTARSLDEYRGPLEDSLSWQVQFYLIADPNSSRWVNNAIETDCLSLVSGMDCNDQFGIRLTVSVPWQSVIFGVSGNTISNWTLNMTETVVGASPCLPYCSMSLGGGVLSGGPEGCIACRWCAGQ